MEIVWMAEDGHAPSCSDPHARADEQRDLLRLSRPSTFFSDRAVGHPHPESIMEMSNSHIKRRE
jgi:hypothetical protein